MDAQMTTVMRKAMRVVDEVLTAKGLAAGLSWYVTAMNNQHWGIAVLDTGEAIRQNGSLDGYYKPSLTHDIKTLMGGRTVILGNTNGIRFYVPLTNPPRLPIDSPLPEVVESNTIPLGVTLDGPVTATPDEFISCLVTGAKGAGKSSLLKMLAYVACRQGWTLYLCDAKGHTFNPDAWSMLSAMPVAMTRDDTLAMVKNLDDELNRRSVLFRRAAEHNDWIMPATLAEYNRLAARFSLETLPYVFFIMDEGYTFLKMDGVVQALTPVVQHSRKWGLCCVVATHSWRADSVTRDFSMLFHIRVTFRVDDDTTGTVALNSHMWGKRAMRIHTKGRGIIVPDSKRIAMFQAYYVKEQRERELLVQAHARQPAEPMLSETETKALKAAHQNEGKMTLAILKEAGVPEREANRLLSKWRDRSWLRKEPQQGNAHILTEHAPKVTLADATP